MNYKIRLIRARVPSSALLMCKYFIIVLIETAILFYIISSNLTRLIQS